MRSKHSPPLSCGITGQLILDLPTHSGDILLTVDNCDYKYSLVSVWIRLGKDQSYVKKQKQKTKQN